PRGAVARARTLLLHRSVTGSAAMPGGRGRRVVSVMLEFGARLGEQVAGDLADLGYCLAVEDHAALNRRLQRRPHHPADCRYYRRRQENRTEPDRKAGDRAAFEEVFHEGHLRSPCSMTTGDSPRTE